MCVCVWNFKDKGENSCEEYDYNNNIKYIYMYVRFRMLSEHEWYNSMWVNMKGCGDILLDLENVHVATSNKGRTLDTKENQGENT